MNLYSLLLHFHSIFRYVALIALVAAVLITGFGYYNKKKYGSTGRKCAIISLGSFHTQVIVGFLLYWLSPKVMFSKAMFKVEILRFFTLEHGLAMIIAAILITIGYSKAKKSSADIGNKHIFIFYLLALVVVLWAIPWPYRHMLAGAWF